MSQRITRLKKRFTAFTDKLPAGRVKSGSGKTASSSTEAAADGRGQNTPAPTVAHAESVPDATARLNGSVGQNTLVQTVVYADTATDTTTLPTGSGEQNTQILPVAHAEIGPDVTTMSGSSGGPVIREHNTVEHTEADPNAATISGGSIGQTTSAHAVVHADTASNLFTTMHATQPVTENKHQQSPESPLARTGKSAPKWNLALTNWCDENQKAYNALNEAIDGALDDPDKVFDSLSDMLDDEETSGSKEKLKKVQPTVAALRGITMAAASLDPHKIAPVVCASIFFSIDIILNHMNEGDRDKILDIMFNCQITIAECVSFETGFAEKGHFAIQELVPGVEDRLYNQYIRVLKLVSDVQHSFIDVPKPDKTTLEDLKAWFSVRANNLSNKFTNRIVDLELRNKIITRKHGLWKNKRDHLYKVLSEFEKATKVRDWIKAGDPKPRLDNLREEVMPDGNYTNAAQWFLDREEFRNWHHQFWNPKDPASVKRFLWVYCTYGTGKTTLIYRTYTELKKEQRNGPRNGAIRIVPYFCDASKASGPSYETILRALIWHMSWLPDATLAQEARKAYVNVQDPDAELGITFWQNLFLELIEESEDQFVFIIDALDECKELEDRNKFLRFMTDKVMSRSNVHLLCSSHKHVPVDNHFKADRRFDIEVNRAATLEDMRTYIDGELQRRERYSLESAFYKQENLLKKLRTQLLEHANGMFLWVQIWLDICLPWLPDLVVETPSHAELILKHLREGATYNANPYDRLKVGYQRLWDSYTPTDKQHRDLRIRLFHTVLATESSWTLTAQNLKDALGVKETTFEEFISEKTVLRLSSGFLQYVESLKPPIYVSGLPRFESVKEMRWVHASANKFISEMTVKMAKGADVKEGEKKDEAQFTQSNNNLVIAEMFIDVVGLSSHPLWTHTWMRLEGGKNEQGTLRAWKHEHHKVEHWIHYRNHKMHECRACYWLHRFLRLWRFDTFLNYLVQHGLRHCELGASQASMFDPTWSKMLLRVVLSYESAFGFTLLLQGNAAIRDRLIPSDRLFPSDYVLTTGWRKIGDIRLERLVPWEKMGTLTGTRWRLDSHVTEFWRHNSLSLLHEDQGGNLRLLPSHVLARLNIIGENDITRLGLEVQEPESIFTPAQLKRLFEHSVYVGGAFIRSREISYHWVIRPMTALEIATREGNRAAIHMMLQSRRGRFSDNSATPPYDLWKASDSIALWLAAVLGHEAIVKLLLEEGEIDVNDCLNSDGKTLLFWAKKNGHGAIVRMVEEKANVNAQD